MHKHHTLSLYFFLHYLVKAFGIFFLDWIILDVLNPFACHGQGSWQHFDSAASEAKRLCERFPILD